MKKGVRRKGKVVEGKIKDSTTREKEKEERIGKVNRTKKEAWKTIDMFVTKGRRPFWYGFK